MKVFKKGAKFFVKKTSGSAKMEDMMDSAKNKTPKELALEKALGNKDKAGKR